MNLKFIINYSTRFGEELILNILGSQENDEASVYRMSTCDGKEWSCNLKLTQKIGTPLDYYYSVVCGENNEVACEWKVVPHRLEINVSSAKEYVVHDCWQSVPEDAYRYSAAFTECLCSRPLSKLAADINNAVLRLKVRAPQLRSGDKLALVGRHPALGEWNPLKAVKMVEHQHNEWVADIEVAKITGGQLEFKFIALDTSERGKFTWEESSNRYLQIPNMSPGKVEIFELENALFPFCNVRCAGTLVPVFSLRSKTSFGIGDFGDLKKMIDWVALTGQHVLQILPINDTTKTHKKADSYPYDSISIFALHPQYADFTALPPIADEKKRAEFEALRIELNALPQVDYERVNKAKNEYLRALYEQEGRAMMQSPEYKSFFKETEQWLVPYAQFCVLRETYGTCDISQWVKHPTFNEEDRKALTTPRTAAYKQAAFYYFVQYILNAQMEAAHKHAQSKGVILKGDIPIGVNRSGCDVWQEPRYYNLNGQAGAPPDAFSIKGQNWGFPTYNWDEMQKDGCRWWVRRFSNMAKFFDAYRIDHVLGFFRIWEIPTHSVHALLGHFSPALGLTREEIEAYGLHFQEDFFTQPFIADWVLERMFGEKARFVREQYLDPSVDGRYRMKPAYDTQRKVEAAFAGETSQEAIDLREGLYSLISNVLFIRDHKNANKFHPRICAQLDYFYEALYDCDKQVFNALYDDYYYHRNNQFWYREAMNKLPHITEATRMLVCAEDLGMVPDCVAWVMNELKILSLEIQSMPKAYGIPFGILENNPYRSVCTISTHDMPTLRGWWDEDDARTKHYYNAMLNKTGEAPHPLPAWLARDIVSRHLQSPSMLCILAIQDWFAIDEHLRHADAQTERINDPSNPHHYWRYRMHVFIEDLMANNSYNQNITDIIKGSGRI